MNENFCHLKVEWALLQDERKKECENSFQIDPCIVNNSHYLFWNLTMILLMSDGTEYIS